MTGTRRGLRTHASGSIATHTQGEPEGDLTSLRREPDLGPVTPTVEDEAMGMSTRAVLLVSEESRDDQAASMLPPQPDDNPHAERRQPWKSTIEDQMAKLVVDLVEAGRNSAPQERLEFLERSLDRLERLLSSNSSGKSTDSHQESFDQAHRLIGVLNKVDPKPYLGSKSTPPTPQQVDRWARDIETAFDYAQVLEDSSTRTQ
jgi:hypothetical protein